MELPRLKLTKNGKDLKFVPETEEDMALIFAFDKADYRGFDLKNENMQYVLGAVMREKYSRYATDQAFIDRAEQITDRLGSLYEINTEMMREAAGENGYEYYDSNDDFARATGDGIGIGLTDAPVIVTLDGEEAWVFMDYQLRFEIEQLVRFGSVIFTYAGEE